MLHRLKIKTLMLLAIALLVSLGAANAQGAELFHCSVEPCRVTLKPDGAVNTKSSHHVLIIKKGAFSSSVTCGEFSGEGTVSKKDDTEITIFPVYKNCNLAGTPATVENGGCHFLVTSHFFSGFAIHVTGGPECAFIIKTAECVISIPRGQSFTGLTYTNINAKTEVTTAASVKNIKGTAGAGCAPVLGFTGSFTEGEYTTGNTIATGETDPGGSMASVWWE